jgi:hypothetical protein
MAFSAGIDAPCPAHEIEAAGLAERRGETVVEEDFVLHCAILKATDTRSLLPFTR